MYEDITYITYGRIIYYIVVANIDSPHSTIICAAKSYSNAYCDDADDDNIP